MKQDPVPKYERAMTENSEAVSAAQRARRRALIVPREHGAWGLLVVPLFTGVAAGLATAHRAWPLLVFTVATLSLFWLRTPLESFIGTGSLTAHTSGERWTALIASICLGAVSAACLTGLMWNGQNSALLFLGGQRYLHLWPRWFFGNSAVGREWRRNWWVQLVSLALLRLLTISAPDG
jgi:hypothetical protein